MIIQDEKVEIIEDENKKELENIQEQKTSTKHIFIYIGVFVAILLILLILIIGGFILYNLKNQDRIAKGIYIYGIDVSELSKSEAKEKLSETFEQIQNTDITLIAEDFETYIKPSEINLEYDIDAAINYAFSIGKAGNIFSDNYDIFDAMVNGVNITPTYSLDDESLHTLLDKLSKELPNAVVESSYYIEGSNLIITKGSDGEIVNTTSTANNIREKLTDLSFLSEPITLSLSPQSPAEVDLDSIYNEIHKDATDAYYTTNPYVVYPSANGIDFAITLQEAKTSLSESEKECTIPLKTSYPSVTTNMLGREAFPDLLATFSTKYATSNTNRTTNLKLAANKVNGTVLLPEETFSYNTVVGERTIAAGYKEAAIYVNGEVVDGLGGGICQISTTLFNAVLLSNLKIVELHNHQFVPSYVTAGRDATVVYGTKDFQFSNSRSHAIKIECSVSKGIVTFNIYGVKEENEYDVQISASITSQTSSYIKSTTYRILKQNGQTVSKEKIYNCTYKRH